MTNDNAHNKHNFPRLISFIPLDNIDTPIETQLFADPTTFDTWVKQKPTCLVKEWLPQEPIDMTYPMVEYNGGREETLYYYNQIKSNWDWDGVLSDAKDNTYEEDGQTLGSCLLGTSTSMVPSGKYYMPWATGDVTEQEAKLDEMYYEALEKVAGEYGGSVESGFGDPLEQFFVISIESEEVTDAE